MKKLSCLLFSLFLVFTFSSIASAQEESKNPEINIKTNPALTQKDNKYKEAIQSLSPEQRDFLEELDAKATQADEAQFEIIIATKTFAACSEVDPSFEQTYSKMMRNFRLSKVDKMKADWQEYANMQRQVDYVNQDLLDGHMYFNRDMQHQFVNGMAEILTENIKKGKTPEKCSEFKSELEKYQIPYAVQANGPPPVVTGVRTSTGQITSCIMSFRHHASNTDMITNALVFSPPQNNQPAILEYSMAINQPDRTRLPIEKAWVDFNKVNTRFVGERITPPDQGLMIGRINTDYIIPILVYLKDGGPITASVKAEQWEKYTTYETVPVNPDNVDKMANCVSTLEPSLSEALQANGFNITPDKQHAEGLKAAKQIGTYLYKTQYLSGKPDNPGGCLFQLPTIKDGYREIGAVLLTAGLLSENHSHNYKTMFWIMGVENTKTSGRRLKFSEASFTVSHPETGVAMDTKDLMNNAIPGERYEVYLPPNDFMNFLNGLQHKGITVSATVEGESVPITGTLKPPQTGAYKIYQDCLTTLAERDKEMRQARQQ